MYAVVKIVRDSKEAGFKSFDEYEDARRFLSEDWKATVGQVGESAMTECPKYCKYDDYVYLKYRDIINGQITITEWFLGVM